MGQALDALTAGGRHQALLDDVLVHVAGLVQGEALQERITEAIAREIRALRWVGLDQAAARLATRKIVAAIANTINEVADQPAHPGARAHSLRQRFDVFVGQFILRLKTDPAFIARGEQLRADLIAHPALGDYLEQLWQQLLAWLDADLARPGSSVRTKIERIGSAIGTRLLADAAVRRWINEQVMAAAPRTIERYREDIRAYITRRVADWKSHELTHELERHIGRDLQFIRVNGTLVGGLVGLLIHAVTQAVRAGTIG